MIFVCFRQHFFKYIWRNGWVYILPPSGKDSRSFIDIHSVQYKRGKILKEKIWLRLASRTYCKLVKNPTQQAYCCGFCLQWTAQWVKLVVLSIEIWKGRPIPPWKAADSTSSEPKRRDTAVREWKRKAYAPFFRTAKIALGFCALPYALLINWSNNRE